MSNALPLIAAAGAAAFLLTKKKKKPAKKKPPTENGSGNGEGEVDQSIVLSGDIQGWRWRVRKVRVESGLGNRFQGEVKGPEVAITWTPAHDELQLRKEIAKNLALEYIAIALEGDAVPITFSWEPARYNSENSLREQFPGVSLGMLDSGAMMVGDIECQWAIMEVLPPIEPGAYAGFVICPKTGEQSSRFSDSIASIKQALEIPSS